MDKWIAVLAFGVFCSPARAYAPAPPTATASLGNGYVEHESLAVDGSGREVFTAGRLRRSWRYEVVVSGTVSLEEAVGRSEYEERSADAVYVSDRYGNFLRMWQEAVDGRRFLAKSDNATITFTGGNAELQSEDRGAHRYIFYVLGRDERLSARIRLTERLRGPAGRGGNLTVDVRRAAFWSPPTPMRPNPAPMATATRREEPVPWGWIALVLVLGTSALGLRKRPVIRAAPAEDEEDRMKERPRNERERVYGIQSARKQIASSETPPEIVGLPSRAGSTVSATPRQVTTEDLAGVARTGNLNPLLEAVAAERLREFDTGKKPRPRTLVQAVFGVPDDATTRTRDALKDMTDTIDEATAMLEARGRFTAAGIQLATAQKRATLEDAKLDAAIAEQAALKVRHEAVANCAVLEDAKLDTAVAEQAARKTEHEARAVLENAKLDTAIAERAAKKAQYEAAARRAEARDQVRESARRHRMELRNEVRAARHKTALQMRELRRSAKKRVAQAQEEVRNLRAQMRALEADQSASAAAQEAEERGRRAAQATIDQLRGELDAANRRCAAHDDELAGAKRNLALERIRSATQKARHDQEVNDAFLKTRLEDARDPAAARRRKADLQHRRELQRIADELQSFTSDAERISYAKRESDAYVQRAAEQYGETSEEHDAALARAEEFMRGLLGQEEI